MAEYFYMDGYGAFVWPAYLVVLAVLIGLGTQSRKQLAKLEKEVDKLRPGDIVAHGEQEKIDQ